MAATTNKNLIFRLGGIGFLLDLDHVVEVVEQIAEILDPSRSDIGRGIVSALKFRKTWIPVVDPALKLGLISSVKIKEKTALVLQGIEGNWAILVDQVVELSSGEHLRLCDTPFLLKVSAMGCYSELLLLNNEPLVVFEPERHYGSDFVPV
ncbi:MAG: chemotaxis protein CheW [Deltaproteobacteria bacterium]|jgi:chemotaxis signal transduction protein|nr:chemotaxis protein CheW [Deltaproteobacteria bacterium]MCW8893077.1 chemotaxis protein CheW [Deltaproteobacteria bacterium]MCW9049808.1 chemotaxis protein CheW [Deltaproteobacteria bacterium]